MGLPEKRLSEATRPAVSGPGSGHCRSDRRRLWLCRREWPSPEPAAVGIYALPEFLRYPSAQATERIDSNTSEKKGVVWTLLTADAPAQVVEWCSVAIVLCPKDGKTAISIVHGIQADSGS